MPDRHGICAFDGSGILRYASKTLGDFDADDILGQPVWNGCANVDEVRNAFAECLLTDKPVPCQALVTDPAGAQFVVRFVFYPLPVAHHCRVFSVWYSPTTGADLSPQEIDCLRLLADGLRMDQIAERLIVSESTVKSAMRRARQKLGAATNCHAVVLAVRAGVV